MSSSKFRIQPVPRQLYEPLLTLSDSELAHHHAKWVVVVAMAMADCFNCTVQRVSQIST